MPQDQDFQPLSNTSQTQDTDFTPLTSQGASVAKGLASRSPGAIGQAWNLASTSLISPNTIGNALGSSKLQELANKYIAEGRPLPAALAQFGAGVTGDIGKAVSPYTSPIGIGTTVAGPALAAAGAPAALQTAAGLVPSIAFGAQGAKQALTSQQPGETPSDALQRRLMGASQVVMGTVGGIESGRGIRQVREPQRIEKATQRIGAGLGIPATEAAANLASPTAPEGINSAKDLRLIQGDLAAIERSSPVKGKNSDATFQRAKNVVDYSKKLWQDQHTAMIDAIPNIPIDHDAVANQAASVITPEARRANPAEARRAEEWIQDGLRQPTTLKSADALLREINQDVDTPAAKQAYGNVLMRAKRQAAASLRDQIDQTLVDNGQSGVRDVNRRFGALNNVADRMIASGLAESRAEGKAPVIPDYLHPYVFMHPSMEGLRVALGFGAHLARMTRSNPASQIGKGMKSLAATEIQPPPKP